MQIKSLEAATNGQNQLRRTVKISNIEKYTTVKEIARELYLTFRVP